MATFTATVAKTVVLKLPVVSAGRHLSRHELATRLQKGRNLPFDLVLSWKRAAELSVSWIGSHGYYV